MNTTSTRYIRGYTLVETLVALALFSVVALVTVGSFVSLMTGNEKARSQKLVFNNLNAALDSMSRTIRDGSTYHCANSVNNSSIATEQDCQGGGTYIAFEPRGGNTSTTADQWVYAFSSSGQLLLSKNGASGPYVAMTAPNVNLSYGRFFVTGLGDNQRRAFIVVRGEAGERNGTKTAFNIQTTVSEALPVDTTVAYTYTYNPGELAGNGQCNYGESYQTHPLDCPSTTVPNNPTPGDGRCFYNENSNSPDCTTTTTTPSVTTTNGRCEKGEGPDANSPSTYDPACATFSTQVVGAWSASPLWDCDFGGSVSGKGYCKTSGRYVLLDFRNTNLTFSYDLKVVAEDYSGNKCEDLMSIRAYAGNAPYTNGSLPATTQNGITCQLKAFHPLPSNLTNASQAEPTVSTTMNYGNNSYWVGGFGTPNSGSIKRVSVYKRDTYIVYNLDCRPCTTGGTCSPLCLDVVNNGGGTTTTVINCAICIPGQPCAVTGCVDPGMSTTGLDCRLCSTGGSCSNSCLAPTTEVRNTSGSVTNETEF